MWLCHVHYLVERADCFFEDDHKRAKKIHFFYSSLTMSVCLMLLLLYMLIISQIRAETQNYPLYMVKSNNHLDDHCLSYYLRRYSICSDFCPYVVNLEQLVAYCLRSSDDNNSLMISDIHANFTFGQLRQLNITSNILLSCSTSVEMAERYECVPSHVALLWLVAKDGPIDFILSSKMVPKT